MSEAAIDWTRIDTVMLDMDGTLLDLRFDNWFWQELIPIALRRPPWPQHQRRRRRCWSRNSGPKRGTIEWYCIEFWSRELGLDIAGNQAGGARAGGLSAGGARLSAKLAASGKRRVLVTNAHPTTLAIKNERLNITPHFDACYSTHAFDAPKEHPEFWPRLHALEPFDAERTLFVDDSLPVLEAAHGFGVGWLRAVRRPDSKHPAQPTGKFAGIDRVADLIA